MLLILLLNLSLTLYPPSSSLLCSLFFRALKAFLPDFGRNLLMNWCQLFVVFFTPFLCPALILLLENMHLFRPVPKKGDCSNPSNYCPITLTSAAAKVFETLLNSHFIKHLESNNLLLDHQYGFRKARSTGDLLSYLTHAWPSSLRNGICCSGQRPSAGTSKVIQRRQERKIR